MLKRFLLVLAVLILAGVVVGCTQSTRQEHNMSVLGSDLRLMQRDFDTVLGLNRTGIYHRYDTPCRVDGH